MPARATKSLTPWQRACPAPRRSSKPPEITLVDGLYRVQMADGVRVGLVIRNGKVASCAPLLFKSLHTLLRRSPEAFERVGDA